VRIKPAPLFLLDEPHYHRVRAGEVNRFAGFALSLDDEPVETMTAGSREVAVDLPSPDVAAFVNLPRAANCRFDFEMRFDGPFEFRANGATLWHYAVPDIAVPRLDAPMPPPEIIEVTQGGRNVEPYRDSILSGHTTMKAMLRRDPRAVLDIGCGTGRLLLGWHAEDPSRKLAGVDINADLIAWDKANMPNAAEWLVSGLEPPLPFADASFDLIQLVSVFTHLPLHIQQMWVGEIRRLLRPGGQAIVTLHGEVYARVFLDQRLRHQFELDGHVSIAGGTLGSNAFASFHDERFARELFGGFDVICYPRGPRDLFGIATFQDVYVLS
jgi:SAM-dependent methyltransferase